MAWNYFNTPSGQYRSRVGLLGSGNPFSGGGDTGSNNGIMGLLSSFLGSGQQPANDPNPFSGSANLFSGSGQGLPNNNLANLMKMAGGASGNGAMPSGGLGAGAPQVGSSSPSFGGSADGGAPLQSLMDGAGGWQDWMQAGILSGGDPFLAMLMHGAGLGSGGIMGMLDPLGIFSPGPNPADAAMPYLDKGSGIVDKYMNPYISAGLQSMPILQSQYGQLVSNPGAVMNRIGSGFQQSPGYQFSVDQATNAANRAAAAGGMLGSPAEQQNLASTVTGLANQDYGNYMNRALGMYGQGLGGFSHMNDLGSQASTNAMQSLMDLIETQAQLAYAGQANQNQAKSGMLGSLMSLAPLAMAFL